MREFVLRSNRVLDNGVIRPAHSVRTATNRSHEISPYPSNNRAAQQFSQSCPRALPSSGLCPFGGACHACPARVQAKLTVSQPNDPYEQEADRVADQVMSMQEPRLQRACPSCEDETLQKRPLAEQITPLVQRQEEPEEEEEPVQAKWEGDNSSRRNPDLDAQIQSLRSGGAPLPSSTRNFFEQRFGNDFGDVRVHSSLQASEAAKSVRAQAFTVGRDIVFSPGKYDPETNSGKNLLAHERTHVVQQHDTLGECFLQRKEVSSSVPTFTIGLHNLNIVRPSSEVVQTIRDAFEQLVNLAGKQLQFSHSGSEDIELTFDGEISQPQPCAFTILGISGGGDIAVGDLQNLRVCCGPIRDPSNPSHIDYITQFRRLFDPEEPEFGRCVGNTAVHELGHMIAGFDNHSNDPNNFMYQVPFIHSNLPRRWRTLEHMRWHWAGPKQFTSEQQNLLIQAIKTGTFSGTM
jgi:hypothetical protein